MSASEPSDETILKDWYHFTSAQDGFVGGLLELLRERQHKSEKDQLKEFGITAEAFHRLKGMPLPRPHQFTRDAAHLARVCQVQWPDRFVEALLLARGLQRSTEESIHPSRHSDAFRIEGTSFYQAAHDVDESLDEPDDKS